MKTAHRITIAIAILLALLMIFLSFGCNPAKQIQKAEQRVLLDPVARHNVFLKELQFYPCANDTFTTYIRGQVDTLLSEVPIFDSFAYKMALSNVMDVNDNTCNERVKEAFDLGVDYAGEELKKIKVRVDTFKYSILDNQIIKLVQDSLTKAERRIYGLEQQNIIQRERLDERRKESEKYLIWFILSIVILVGSNLLWFKFKIGKVL